MNALEMARTTYSSTAAPTRTPRGTEYEAFMQITRNLRSASQNKEFGYGEFVKALNENRRLWMILASDVSSERNALPKELRAQIFYLAEFTFHHTSKILSKTADEKALIDINMSILRGLNPSGPSQ